MGDCSRCGGSSSIPRVTVRNVTVARIDGATAIVQFRLKLQFNLNGQLQSFLSSEIKRVSYSVILAALAVTPNPVIFLNAAEKQDFKAQHPEAQVD
jgi:hypothetical protein